jgi:hypothetical protein
MLPLLNGLIGRRLGLRIQSAGPAAAVLDFNELLHGCRSACLRAMPKVTGTMLSAGCSGRWYFDWIAERTGHGGRHVGVERYSPRPGDLPANVEWITNSVSDMYAVADGSCALVFSGQNIEHLWPEETLGFLTESWRVLEPGGWLVVDSPNRLLTERLVWSHPEHTIEFTPAEAKRLLELGGFDVRRIKGLWLGRDPQSGRTLPLTPAVGESQWSLYERLLSAEHDPDNSFLWWIEASRSERPPKRDAMCALLAQVFEQAWPERCSRFQSAVGTMIVKNGRRMMSATPQQSGAIVFGPYVPLKAGAHSATFSLVAEGAPTPDTPVMRCDVVGARAREIAVRDLTSRELEAADGRIGLDFDLSELEFGIQARCIALGAASVQCECWPQIK